MKKIPVLFIALFAISFCAKAQDNAYQMGQSTIHLSVGVAPTFGLSTSGLGFHSSWSLPLSGTYEYGVSDRISVGITAGSASQKFTDDQGDGVKYNYLLIGARGSYHFATSEKFDPYVGLLVGYNNVKAKDIGSGQSGLSAKASGVLPGAYLGANYYFATNIGVHAEVGYGISVVTAGISLRF